MIEVIPLAARLALLEGAGWAGADVSMFLQDLDALRLNEPGDRRAAHLSRDAQRLGFVCRQGRTLLERLPLKSKRSPKEKAAGLAVVHLLADASWRFFRLHRQHAYDALTKDRTRPLRVAQIAEEGAALLPGILPTAAELADESGRFQRDKDGLEIQQGLFFAQLLSDPGIGLHLCTAMLRPTAEAAERLSEFQRTGTVDLGTARVEAREGIGYLYFHHPRTLNAEGDDTIAAQETACDLILLHPGLRIGVLRGDPVDHPKYKGRRIFSSGINLTRIYQGKQSYLFYLTRDLGFVNKMYRGLAAEDAHGRMEIRAGEPEQTIEKPWLAAVDAFAIGGGCQLLLVMDYVIAEKGAYFNLPARKEGIIPGCANLRLPRFMGDRLAREAIMFDKTFYVDEPHGSTLVNEVHAPERMDEAIEQCAGNALGSGMVSAGANRKALRVQAEPLDTFRAYMATNAYEQAFCHLSDQLVSNLERHWIAKGREP